MKPPSPNTARAILRRETLGFSLLAVSIWVVEICHVPHLLYGVPAEFSLTRVLLRTALVLLIWAWVHVATRRLLRRLHELEEFLLICSWCRKVGHDGRWLTTEELFDSHFATGTSHGICPDCARQQFTAQRVPPRPQPA